MLPLATLPHFLHKGTGSDPPPDVEGAGDRLAVAAGVDGGGDATLAVRELVVVVVVVFLEGEEMLGLGEERFAPGERAVGGRDGDCVGAVMDATPADFDSEK